ncbi:MAG: type II toxin-antitoxin system RelE/ParE family toxin [Gammaproteobacteria bacterium]|nr:type II toxin-antitoxin system RelE/ParE family toxin [Gammaproteobacteria bacterium]
MHYTLRSTKIFKDWLRSIRDQRAKHSIAQRLDRVQIGNFGDCSPVCEGVSELRIFVGKGYRVYLTVRKQTIVFLLCGGHKGSQARDISLAKELNRQLDDNQE